MRLGRTRSKANHFENRVSIGNQTCDLLFNCQTRWVLVHNERIIRIKLTEPQYKLYLLTFITTRRYWAEILTFWTIPGHPSFTCLWIGLCEGEEVHICRYCVVFNGVVIAALMHCDLFEIYCAPPNLDITRTWICRLNFAQRPIFFRLEVL